MTPSDRTRFGHGDLDGPRAASFQGVSASLPTGSCAISPEGLVLAYDMRSREGRDSLRDFSGLGNHGRVVGTEAIPGPFGSAARFRTAEDYVRLPSRRSLHGRGPLTIAAWVRFTELGLHQHVVSYDDLYTLWVSEEDRFRFTDTQGDAFESEAGCVPLRRWCAVVAIFGGRPGTPLSGETISLTVDGRPLPGRAIGAWSPGRPVEGFVGKESHEGQFHLPLRADIATLLIFNRALAPPEAAAFGRAPTGMGVDAHPRRQGRTPGSATSTAKVRIAPRVVRITNLLPPYRLPQHEILRDCPLTVFETWLMTRAERNRRWPSPRDPTVRTFPDWGLDLSHRDMFAVHLNPGMVRELARRPPSLVLLGGYEQPTCILVGLLLDRLRVPFLVNSESISLGDSVVGRRASFLARAILRKSAGVIASGRASVRHFLELGVPPNRIFVAPPSVDVRRFTPPGSDEEKRAARELLGFPEGTVCLCVGRLTASKGVLDLLDAFALLRPSGRGISLHLVGDGPLRSQVEARIAGDVALRDSVSLHGYLPDALLPKVYQAADIFVFPTHRDVWGLVLNEAMCAGLAVISSDGAAAAADLIQDGANGLVVRSGDSRAFAEAIRRLHEDTEVRARLGQAARETILAGFTPRDQARAILRAVMTTLGRVDDIDGDLGVAGAGSSVGA